MFEKLSLTTRNRHEQGRGQRLCFHVPGPQPCSCTGSGCAAAWACCRRLQCKAECEHVKQGRRRDSKAASLCRPRTAEGVANFADGGVRSSHVVLVGHQLTLPGPSRKSSVSNGRAG